MTGWVIVGILAVAVAALYAVAWWSGGNRPPLRSANGLSPTEKDYLAAGSQRSTGNQASFL